MASAVDRERGGLKGAPKFPQWSFFWLLWRGAIRYGHTASRHAVDTTLTHICQGGIYDHLGGGFARYAVDERWLVPHFEKMLYDNALLTDLMCEAYRETANPLYAARIDETVGWLLREMVADGGAFAASLDADSEGEEGKFYLWSRAEIADVLGETDAAVFAAAYDVTEAGNWEGRNILNRLHNPMLGLPADEKALREMRGKLLARRSHRTRPGWDDKVLADWNGLMIAALVHAAKVMDRPEWLTAAARAFTLCCRPWRRGPPAPLLARWPSQGPGHCQRLRQYDLGGTAPIPGHQRERLSDRCRALVRQPRPAPLGCRGRRLRADGRR